MRNAGAAIDVVPLALALHPEIVQPPGLSIDDLLAAAPVISEEELGGRFDALLELAAQQPDDAEAQFSIRSLVQTVQEQGKVALAMQMAMTVGAMACTHSHMEGLANEIGESLIGSKSEPQADPHSRQEQPTHSETSCENCKHNRPCTKKKS